MAKGKRALTSQEITNALWSLYGLGAYEEGVACKFAAENEDILLLYWAGLGMNDQLLSQSELYTIEEHVSHCVACSRERDQRRCINQGEPLIWFDGTLSKQVTHIALRRNLSNMRPRQMDAQTEVNARPKLAKKSQKIDAFLQKSAAVVSPLSEVTFQLGSIRPSEARPLAATLSNGSLKKNEIFVPIPDEATALFRGLNKQCRLQFMLEGTRAPLTARIPSLAPEQAPETVVRIKIRRTDETGRVRPGLDLTGRPGAQWGPYKITNFSPGETWDVQMIVVSEGSDRDASDDRA